MIIPISNNSAGRPRGRPNVGVDKPLLAFLKILLAVSTVMAPYAMNSDNGTIYLHIQSAWAKDAGGSNGKGQNGNSGNGKGQSGNNGNGQSSNKGNTNDQRGANDSAPNSGGLTGAGKAFSGSSPKSIDNLENGTPDRKFQHANGMMEAIVNGRYLMKDAKNRTIIDRKATPSDQLRLRTLTQ